jgi:hypothetical protein
MDVHVQTGWHAATDKGVISRCDYVKTAGAPSFLRLAGQLLLIDVAAMLDTKQSLDITQGTTMVEPAVALSRANSEVGKVTDFDPDKPYPTEEEFATLPRVPGTIPWTAWTVAIVEFAERFSYYGTTAVCE